LIALVIRSGENGDAASATGSQSAQLRQLTSLLQGTLAISASALPLPAGAASETTLGSVLTALQGNINFSDTIWTDDSGTYFIRQTRQNQDTNTITVSYLNLDGTAYTVGSNPRPADRDRDVELRSFTFRTNNSGTGYSSGQTVVRADVLDVSTSTASILSTAWFNASTNATIAAPTTGHLDVPPDSALTDAQLRASAVPVSAASLPLPSGAATDSTVAGLLTNTQLRASAVPVSLASVPLATGAATDSTVSTMSGKLPASLGIKTAANSLSIAPASDGVFVVGSRSSGTLTNANGSTSAIPSTWATVFAAGTNLEVFIQNASDTLIEVGLGASPTTVAWLSAADTFSAGGSWGYVAPSIVPGEAISVRCSVASKAYVALRRT
jgi:hypothetical protein